MTDLDAIRRRWETAELTRLDYGAGPLSSTSVGRSAEDVPELLAEIADLREAKANLTRALDEAQAEAGRLRAEVHTLTNSEDARVFIAEQERDAARADLEDARRELGRLRNDLAARRVCECLDCAQQERGR